MQANVERLLASDLASPGISADAMDESVARFAVSYADQTERDHDRLRAAGSSGRIEVAGRAR